MGALRFAAAGVTCVQVFCNSSEVATNRPPLGGEIEQADGHNLRMQVSAGHLPMLRTRQDHLSMTCLP